MAQSSWQWSAMYVVTVGVSFITLLFITTPACICSCSKHDDDDDKNCCTPTYFVSVAVAGSISVIGMFIAGTTQVFAVYTYEDLSSLIRAAAAMNFIATLFGILLIITTLCTCLSRKENWLFCEERPSCTFRSVIAFLFITALLVTVLIAGLLTMFMSFLQLWCGRMPARGVLHLWPYPLLCVEQRQKGCRQRCDVCLGITCWRHCCEWWADDEGWSELCIRRDT